MSKTEKTATAITLLILLSNLVGYVREMLLANYFGASFVIDAYLMAQSIAFIVFNGIMAAIATGFVPLYSQVKEKQGKQGGNQFTSGILNLVLLITAILSIPGIIFAEPIVSVFAYGFSGQVHMLTVHFVRIGFIVASIFSLNEIAKTYLHCNDGFTVEKIAGFSVNAGIIIFIFLSAGYHYQWLMYGYLLGYSANLILCLYFAGRKGFRFQFTLPDRSMIKQILVMVLPVFIGSTAGQINSLVDRFLASGLREGSVSVLGYAGTINNMLLTLATAAILLMIYPKLSGYIAQNDLEQFKKTLSRSMDFLIIILIPLTFGTIALANPGVSILYERGQFGSTEVMQTSGVLILFSIGMLGAGLNNIISKAFYAVQDSKTPMKIGFLSIFINIALSLLLIGPMTFYGLALASSLAALLVVIPNALLLRREIGQINYLHSLYIFLKSLAAAIIMSAAAHKTYIYIAGFLSIGFFMKLLALGAAILTGILVYLIILWFLQVKELTVIYSLLKNTMQER